ncbi:MAG: hypothetical protein ACP5N7_05625 [Candidatus Pacearchaeota archaeon]
MPSPKFDKLQVYFSQKIGDPVSTASTTTPTSNTTKETRDIYINRAMMKLFNDTWVQSQGNVEKFIEIFPELYKIMEVTTNSSGIVTSLPAGFSNYFVTIEGERDTDKLRVKFVEKVLYQTVKNNENKQYLPSATNLFGFEISKQFKFFPATEFNAKKVNLAIIIMPLTTAGAAFVNGGTEDIPFTDHWYELITELALQIWKEDNQGGV